MRRIRHEILSGALAPGERLIEEQLTQRFGTSRAPLREALRTPQVRDGPRPSPDWTTPAGPSATSLTRPTVSVMDASAGQQLPWHDRPRRC
ncbi:GntR family transcriptional regulator [Sphaerisporangium sp. NPDC049002]|uniref:GntR family transcriptional regulator n=1 Tax=Sphaerisporangium sp. NPDC049002 TaxID=3155392 RepID=UPI0033D7F577